jgi:hypothetical protein
MHLNEEVAAVTAAANPDKLCQGEEEPEDACKPNKCRLGKKKGELGAPTAKELNKQMKVKSSGVFIPDDPPKKGGAWDLDQCNSSAFPYQSHHLIPKMHLPDHQVCIWLSKKCKNGHYELTKSTNYDTDHARNGMALPFASNTYQWKKAKNAAEEADVCNTMMKNTGLQLHQGQHTNEDYGEEDELHAKEQPGYLGAVDKLLDIVYGLTLEHVLFCDDCKKGKKPAMVRPLERVVDAMYTVSAQMQGIIRLHKRFVSERAAAHFGNHVMT